MFWQTSQHTAICLSTGAEGIPHPAFMTKAFHLNALTTCVRPAAQSELLSSFISDDFQVAGLCEEPEFTSADFQPHPHPHDRHPQL